MPDSILLRVYDDILAQQAHPQAPSRTLETFWAGRDRDVYWQQQLLEDYCKQCEKQNLQPQTHHVFSFDCLTGVTYNSRRTLTQRTTGLQYESNGLEVTWRDGSVSKHRWRTNVRMGWRPPAPTPTPSPLTPPAPRPPVSSDANHPTPNPNAASSTPSAELAAIAAQGLLRTSAEDEQTEQPDDLEEAVENSTELFFPSP